jgi:predicted nucleic acid-binding protein
VILVDANILIYAMNRAAPEHDAAREWLDARLNGTARVGLPWPSLLAFVRTVSNPAILARAVSSRMVPDAHLAALAIEHGLTLCSTDGDFLKFQGVKWENPLAAH